MYKYHLINNHYIIDIDGYNYLLDTGSPFSFFFGDKDQILIDGKSYRLWPKPTQLNNEETFKCIGMKVDGFIGLDIIKQTSLTIYKNGYIDFSANKVDGKELDMNNTGFLSIKVGCNLMSGEFIIDTGAKYGYGIKGLFYNQKPFDHVKDYNPNFNHLDSDIYHLHIVVGGKDKTIDVCKNDEVGSFIRNMGALIIGNITSLFDEVCVIDTQRNKLILK